MQFRSSIVNSMNSTQIPSSRLVEHDNLADDQRQSIIKDNSLGDNNTLLYGQEMNSHHKKSLSMNSNKKIILSSHKKIIRNIGNENELISCNSNHKTHIQKKSLKALVSMEEIDPLYHFI